MFRLLAALNCLLLIACVPMEKEYLDHVEIKLSDPEYQKIIDYRDRQIADSLYDYFRHPDPGLRYSSALAFGSFVEEEHLDSLATLLSDRVPEVREAAAFSIGQSRLQKAEDFLIPSFARADSSRRFQASNAAILEAVGKCASTRYLNALATISSYTPSDTALLLGQARGIYQYALRGIVLPDGTEAMTKMLDPKIFPEEVRLVAANYLHRARNTSLNSYSALIREAFSEENSMVVKSFLATAITKLRDPSDLQILIELLASANTDYRIKCKILGGLNHYNYRTVLPIIEKALSDSSLHVRICAAQYLLLHGIEEDAMVYRNWARAEAHWRVRGLIYEAVNKHLPFYYTISKTNLRNELRRLFTNSSLNYEKASLIIAMSHDINNHNLISQLSFQDPDPVVRSAGARAMGLIANSDQIKLAYRYNNHPGRYRILKLLHEAVLTGDPGMIYEVSRVLGQGDLDWEYFKTYYLPDLETALSQLKLPKDLEAFLELRKAIYRLKGQEEPEYQLSNDFKKVDWSLLKSNDIKASIKTNKGEMTVQLWPQIAPLSTSNFIELAEKKYFEGKKIHRVVPDFVIQDGCPRGDGLGSEDFTIRSEYTTSRYDREGILGMASAGPHTEATQWFMTHTPTLHLDGRYSCFGELAQGREVLHQIEMGDSIKQITIIYE